VFGTDDVPIVAYAVACTSPFGVGFETQYNQTILNLIGETEVFHLHKDQLNQRGKTALSEEVLNFAFEFAKDLKELAPLSKLQGLNPSEESRTKLPNLSDATVDQTDDLVAAVDELLCPDSSI